VISRPRGLRHRNSAMATLLAIPVPGVASVRYQLLRLLDYGILQPTSALQNVTN